LHALHRFEHDYRLKQTEQDGLSSRGQLSTSNAELNKYYGCNINNLSQILLNFHGHLSS